MVVLKVDAIVGCAVEVVVVVGSKTGCVVTVVVAVVGAMALVEEVSWYDSVGVVRETVCRPW